MSIKSAFPGEMPRVNVDTYLRTAKENIHMFKDCVGDNRAELILMELSKIQSRDSYNQWITAQKLMDEIEKRTLLNVPPPSNVRGVTAYPNWVQYERAVRSLYEAQSDMSVSQAPLTPSKQLAVSAATAAPTVAHQASAVSMRLDQTATDLRREHARIKALSGAPDDDIVQRIDLLMAQAHTLPADDAVEMGVDGEEDPAAVAALKEHLRQLRFRALTPAERGKVINVVQGPNNGEVLIDKFCTPMSRLKMVCLRPNTWLNDEVRV